MNNHSQVDAAVLDFTKAFDKVPHCRLLFKLKCYKLRQMQEKFRVKGKKLYFGFVDMEKAFDRVPREVMRWAMRNLAVEEWLIAAVMSMYTGAKTVVRTVYGNSECTISLASK